MIFSLPQAAMDTLVKELGAKQALAFASTSKKKRLMRENLLRDVLLFSLNRCTNETEQKAFIGKYKPFYVYLRVKDSFAADLPEIANFLRIENDEFNWTCLHENVRVLIINCICKMPSALPESLLELEFTLRSTQAAKPLPVPFKLPSKLAVLRFHVDYPHSIKHVALPKSLRVCWLPVPDRDLSFGTMHRAMAKLGSNGNSRKVLNALVIVVRVLANETLIDDVLPALPQLVALLQSDEPAIKLEAARALNKIAVGTAAQKLAIVVACALPLLVDLFSDPDDNVREQAIEALGSAIEGSLQARDNALSLNAVPRLLKSLGDDAHPVLADSAMWTLVELSTGTPRPSFELVAPALPVVANYVGKRELANLLTPACWVLAYVTDPGTNERIQAVLDTGVLPRLVHILTHAVGDADAIVEMQRAVLRCVSSIAVAQTQLVVDSNVLPLLARLVVSPALEIRRYTCALLSYILAGSINHIDAVIDESNGNFIAQLVRLLSNDESTLVRREACWAIANAITHGSVAQIDQFVRCGAIPPLVEMLNVMFNTEDANSLVNNALDAIRCILVWDNETKRHALQLKECVAMKPLKMLFMSQRHTEKIKATAATCLEMLLFRLVQQLD